MIEDIYTVKNNIIINKNITDINKKRFLRVEAGIMIKTAKNYGHARHSPIDFGYIYSGFYVYAGRGVYIDCSSGTEVVFSKGDFVQRIPGVEHETNCIDESGWREIYILFDGSFFDSFSDCGMMSCEPVLHIGTDDIVEKRCLRQLTGFHLHPTVTVRIYSLRCSHCYMKLTKSTAAIKKFLMLTQRVNIYGKLAVTVSQ